MQKSLKLKLKALQHCTRVVDFLAWYISVSCYVYSTMFYNKCIWTLDLIRFVKSKSQTGIAVTIDCIRGGRSNNWGSKSHRLLYNKKRRPLKVGELKFKAFIDLPQNVHVQILGEKETNHTLFQSIRPSYLTLYILNGYASIYLHLLWIIDRRGCSSLPWKYKQTLPTVCSPVRGWDTEALRIVVIIMPDSRPALLPSLFLSLSVPLLPQRDPWDQTRNTRRARACVCVCVWLLIGSKVTAGSKSGCLNSAIVLSRSSAGIRRRAAAWSSVQTPTYRRRDHFGRLLSWWRQGLVFAKMFDFR